MTKCKDIILSVFLGLIISYIIKIICHNKCIVIKDEDISANKIKQNINLKKTPNLCYNLKLYETKCPTINMQQL